MAEELQPGEHEESEAQPAHEQVAKEKPSVLHRIGRTIKRIIIFFLLFLVIGCLCIAVLTQTSGFRHWLRDRIVAIVNEQLDAKVEFSDIGGNLLTGITLDNVRLITAGDTVVFAKQISVRYDLEPLFSKSIVVNRIYLDSPVIKLIRSTDSTWNYEHIAKPSSDTSAAKPFDWNLNMRNLTLSNATFIMRDSTTPPAVLPQGGNFESTNMRYDSLDLSITATGNIAKKRFAVAINHMALKDYYSTLRVRNLAAHVTLDTGHVEVYGLQVYTDQSHFRLDAQLEKLNIFENSNPEFWKTTPAQVSLNVDSLNARDIQRFIPALNFLKGSFAMKLDAEGTYGNLKINTLKVKMENTDLSMEGRILNLNNPDSIYIDAHLDKTRLSYRDARNHAPGIELPDLSYLGTVSLDEALFKGYTKNFNVKFKARTDIGNAEGVAQLDLRGKIMKYTAQVSTEHLNIAPPLQSPEMASSLNAHISVSGSGLTLQEMNTKLHVEATASSIGERSFKNLLLSSVVRDRGMVTIDTLAILWASPDNSYFRGNGQINLRSTKQPEYAFDAVMNRINGNNILPGQNMKTDITGHLHIEGRGFDPDSIEGKVIASFEHFETPQKTFDSLQFTIALDRQPDNYRNLTLNSNIADITLKGRYRFASLAEAMSLQIQNLTHAIQNRYTLVQHTAGSILPLTDTTNKIPVKPLAYLNADEPLDATFSVQVHDLSLASLASSNATMEGQASLKGSVKGTTHAYSLTVDSSQIRYFLYRDSATYFSLSPVSLDAKLENLALGNNLSAINGHIHIVCDSIIQLNDDVLRHTQVNVEYQNDRIRFFVASDINDNIDLFTHGEGTFDIADNTYLIDMDSLTIGYRKDLRWSSRGRIHAVIGDNSILIDSLSLQRRKGETISVKGKVTPARFENVQLLVEGFPLSDIERFLPANNEKASDLALLTGRLSKLGLTINGTPENPDIELFARLDSLRYNGLFIGNQVIDLTHKNATIQGSTIVVNPFLKGDSTTLELTINSLPVNLALAPVKERIVAGKPVDISLKAKKLSLGLIAPFVPSIDKLQGFADASFTINGQTPGNITYSGNAKLYNTSFILSSTNIKYFADGDIGVEKDKITVRQINLYNDPADLSGGRASVNGEIDLAGLDLKKLDLYINAPNFLVMSNASKAVSPLLYGEMIIGTDKLPLHFHGTLDAPILEGSVNIRHADLVFPEDKSVKRSSQQFCYEMVQDIEGKHITYIDCPPSMQREVIGATSRQTSTATTTVQSPDSSHTEKEPRDSTSKTAIGKLTNAIIQTVMLRPKQSFVDKMDMNLDIDIPGRFFLTMDFGTLQQLNAEVGVDPTEGPLHFSQSPGGYKSVRGALVIKDGSTLKFYKNFDVDGKISFPAGAIDNPILDLNALYKGQRVVENSFQSYQVMMHIVGTKSRPDYKVTYELDGVPGTGDSAKILADAIFLIVFGRTQQELLAGGGGGDNLLSSQGRQAGAAAASSLLSGVLSGIGVIRTAEIEVASDETGKNVDLSRSRIHFTGELGGLYYQYNSDVDLANKSFSLDIPLGLLLTDQAAFRNLVLELSRSANTVNTVTTQQKEWELKLGWRFSF